MQYPSGNILIVGNQTERFKALQNKLQQSGFLVICVADGLDAISAFTRGTFDLVLTEIDIPGLNGNLLARYVRNLRPETVIIAVTATPWLANNTFDQVVQKPFEAWFLADSIAYCGTIVPPRLEPVERTGYQPNA